MYNVNIMSFKIQNRRYTGSKQKLLDWIRDNILKEAKDCNSFCDLFAGTGVVTNAFINDYKVFYINDFLYSNFCIYNAFFGKEEYEDAKLVKFKREFNELNANSIQDNYMSVNFGGKFFSHNDALLIGEIRERIQNYYSNKDLNEREFNILLASLIYSFDKCANTVGHYEAYIRKSNLKDLFKFELIDPVIFNSNDSRIINISREDSNQLVRKIQCDIVYIDPPYSSRQYSRFYHLIETVVKWDKPKLFGTALKPVPENMSEYCSSRAIDSFRELIADLNCKYIFVSYNNTYNSKSNSSKNKMDLDDMVKVLTNKGKTKILEKKHNAFNAGKTDLSDHKEYLFVTEVKR